MNNIFECPDGETLVINRAGLFTVSAIKNKGSAYFIHLITNEEVVKIIRCDSLTEITGIRKDLISWLSSAMTYRRGTLRKRKK